MSLVRRDLIRPDRSMLAGEDAFRFRHQLIRDAAYEAAPKALRAELHERFADWLEGVGEARVEEFEEILAYHLEQAHRLLSELGPLDEAGRELGLRAATHYAASARRASDRSDDRAAATLFRHAADLLPEGHPDRPRALYDVGRASLRGLDPPVASAALDEAVAAAAASGQRSIEWMARIDRGLVQMMVDPIGFTSDDLRAERGCREGRARGGWRRRGARRRVDGARAGGVDPVPFRRGEGSGDPRRGARPPDGRSVAPDGRDDLAAGDRAARVDVARRRAAVARSGGEPSSGAKDSSDTSSWCTRRASTR